MLVPGLLQTSDYARAVFNARFGITDEEIGEQVAARLKRQEILARDEPPALWVILDESVLRRPVGGRYVMREQVGRLIEASRRPHVSVQVISSSVGAHRGLWAGAFIIANFEDAPTVGSTPGTLGVSVFLGCSAFRVLYVFLSLFSWWCRRRAGMDRTRVSRRVRRGSTVRGPGAGRFLLPDGLYPGR